jgi:hypothetical protein
MSFAFELVKQLHQKADMCATLHIEYVPPSIRAYRDAIGGGIGGEHYTAIASLTIPLMHGKITTQADWDSRLNARLSSISTLYRIKCVVLYITSFGKLKDLPTFASIEKKLKGPTRLGLKIYPDKSVEIDPSVRELLTRKETEGLRDYLGKLGYRLFEGLE